MEKDLTLLAEGGYLNIRVGAIIMRNGKVLMAGNEKSDYLYSVGGRVKFGETAEEAVLREVYEETGVHLEIDRLGFVHENMFIGDSGRVDKLPVYEISFFFYMKAPEDFEPVCMSFAEGNSKEYLEWIALDDPRTFYPEFFRKELKHPTAGMKHIVTDEIGAQRRMEIGNDK